MEIDEDSPIPLPEAVDASLLLGPADENLIFIQRLFDAKLVLRNQQLRVISCNRSCESLPTFLQECFTAIQLNHKLDLQDLVLIRDGMLLHGEPRYQDFETVLQTPRGVVRCKTFGQDHFYRTAMANDITFALGPAGTGKTYLAVAIGLKLLFSRQVDRLVFSRPAIEAGESLGFLPGDLKMKVDPYLRPIYDALFDMVDPGRLKKLLENETIEISPLAYMRGRTLNNAFILLDEAQNTTFSQMKMFLTRIGVNSRALINGDLTQTDLPGKVPSGLAVVRRILGPVQGIRFVDLGKGDVVRHALVRDIIDAYDRYHADEP